MAVASFEDLCAGFCELARVAPPALTLDDRGFTAFHATLQGVTVNLVHYPMRYADHAFVLFEFGAIDDDDTDPNDALNQLLDANFRSLQVHAPVFSRNPVSGEVVLRHVYPLFDATPNGLLDLIEDGVDQALQWRQSLCASAHPPIPSAYTPVSMANFV